MSAPTLSSAVDIQPETKSLVSKVIAIIDEGQGNLPKWLSSLRKERGDLYKKIMSMITIGEDLKTKLGKLRTPNAMQDLKDIHLRYVDLLSNNDTQESSVATTAAPSSSSSSIPLYDYADQTREPIDKVLNFLSTIEETTGGNLHTVANIYAPHSTTTSSSSCIHHTPYYPIPSPVPLLYHTY